MIKILISVQEGMKCLHRHDDLIRQGQFISKVVECGKAAYGQHIVFPIPQVEIDRNINLSQNNDYSKGCIVKKNYLRDEQNQEQKQDTEL